MSEPDDMSKEECDHWAEKVEAKQAPTPPSLEEQAWRAFGWAAFQPMEKDGVRRTAVDYRDIAAFARSRTVLVLEKLKRDFERRGLARGLKLIDTAITEEQK